MPGPHDPTAGASTSANAGAWLESSPRAGAGTAACIRSQGSVLTYREAAALVRRWSAAFRSRGYAPGSRVLLALSDGPAHVGAFLGAMRCGLIPVLVSPRLGGPELAAVIADSDAVAAFYDRAAATQLQSAIGGLPGGRRAVEALDLDQLDDPPGVSEDRDPPVAVSPRDPAFILCSSGSTGRPKLVLHAHASLFQAGITFANEILGIGAEDTVVSSSKLHHAYGLGNSVGFPFWSGASTVLLAGPATPEALVGAVRDHGVSILCAVPRLFEAIAASPALDADDLSSLRLCTSAGERLAAETCRAWSERFGLTIVDLVGSTEMLHGFLSSSPDAVIPGSCGRPVTGTTVRLVGDDGAILRGAGSGEAYVTSPSAFLEYWRDPVRTRQVLDDGSWRTGDRYRRDEDGNHWYLGRVDDLFKVNGLWVVPARIEETLMAHPAVAEAAVVGVTDGGRTRVKALLVCADPDETTIVALRRHCAEHLAVHEQPTQVEFIDALPRGATGKVLKYLLR